MNRKSSIELLRVVCIIGVVILHFQQNGIFENAQRGGANYVTSYLMFSLCICAVNVFILIFGFFSCDNYRRSLSKPFTLLVQVSLFSLGAFFLRCILGREDYGVKAMIYYMIPKNWFLMVYIAIYLISPYINRCFNSLNKKEANRLIMILVAVFSLWPTVADLMEEKLGEEVFGISTIGAWGSEQGCNIVNISLVYIIGAYIKKYLIESEFYKKIKIGHLLAALACDVMLIFIWSIVMGPRSINLCSAWVYHNPLVIFEAILIFLIFYRMQFNSRVINELSKCTFTMLIMQEIMYENRNVIFRISTAATGPLGSMLLLMAGVIAICFVSSYAVYKLYTFITKPIFDRINKLAVFRAYDIG